MARRGFHILAIGLGLCSAAAWAQPYPPAPEDQQRSVGGWLVVHEPDTGGRMIRLRRSHGNAVLEYHASYWHGNGRPIRGTTTEYGGTSCGDYPGWEDTDADRGFTPPRDVAGMARALRAAWAEDLAACGAAPPQIAAALQGLEPAMVLAASWEEEARRWMIGVIDSIVDYGTSDDETSNGAEPR